MLIVRNRIQITGVVQGVGFRPFVWRLATELGCTGYVCNDASGVLIEVQGFENRVVEFQRRLTAEAPSPSRISGVHATPRTPSIDETSFVIGASQKAESPVTGVAPDISVCSECLRELKDPSNRRFGYPFINCTNCGPRYTIVESLPYDRPRTTMRGFKLCEACIEEYESPGDRRFHAEPNACAACGPKIWFLESKQPFVDLNEPTFLGTKTLDFEVAAGVTRNVLETVQARLADGQIVAIKGIGGFHLACDAMNRQAVQRLRERKLRSEKPFAVMVADVESCKLFAKVHAAEARLLTSPQRPIVLLEKNTPCDWIEAVAPGNPSIGVMLAYSPLHYLLIPPGQVWVMTSGNLSDEPIAIDNRDAWVRLANIADGILFHNRPISVECDDSVLRLTNTGILPIRRSRGFAPLAIDFHSASVDRSPMPTVLAVGGELKATVCLAINEQAFLSQHIGDMENEETLKTMQRVSKHLLDLYQTKADVIAADLHPGYLSVGLAEKLASDFSIPLITTQHHHAHAASLMAEHSFPEDSRIIACVFDGTGFGSDGTIWGGEWLIASAREFQRFAHLGCIPLPGGDACVLRPGRSALAHLYAESIEWSPHLPCVQTLTAMQNSLLEKQLDKRINCIETSSMGRLFDAVASLIGVRQEISYEGQAAIELEGLATAAFRSEKPQLACYPFRWEQAVSWELRLGEMLRQIIRDYQAGVDAGEIGLRFHQTIAQASLEVCKKARMTTGIWTVGLTGGVFQNLLLAGLVRTALEKHGFRVVTHRQVPPNDAGLALGQAAIARAQWNSRSS